MRQIVADKKLIAFCGLYCGSCKKLLNGKCPGCKGNDKATWCRTRTCCLQNGYASCADCGQFQDTNDCKKLNNLISKVVGLILQSDRRAGLEIIRERGYDAYAQEMSDAKTMSPKR